MPEVRCPSQENPYFFTFKNSNYSSFPVEPRTKTVSQQRSFGTDIPCIDRNPSDTIPASVHNLRPADIKVIGALGDSITAGNGAGSSPNNVLDVLTQYRGLSWSVGGNENISTVTTLANILREFNPSLLGYSSGKGSQSTSNAYLNQAVAGARAEGLLSQARKLIDLMKTDSKINFQEDWKLVTIFIGGNDLCDHCKDPVLYSAENFVSNIQAALDILHKEVPRTFVNLVSILHITTLRKLYQDKRISVYLCFEPNDNSTEIETLELFNKRYQEGIHGLVESGRYDVKEDFTVVVQPFFEEVRMPETPEGLPDSSYFAPDCFHFSQKGHSQGARALWNNMVRKISLNAIIRPLKSSSECDLHQKNTPRIASSCLKPADVQVIAALGDSLTVRNIAPFAIPQSELHHSLLFFKTTEVIIFFLSDILREFNANLTGYSTGTGDLRKPTAFLNQAVPRAPAEKLPDQVKHLVKLMKNDSRINFDTDWKVITVFIGVHDLCNYCKDMVSYGDVLKALRCWMKAKTVVFRESVKAFLCDGTPFIFIPQSSLQSLVETGKYDTQEDFTVVLQPFLQSIVLPLLQDGRPDISFFAPDCFHLSQKSHSQLSRALWNNMLQPLGKKSISFNFTDNVALSCPTLKTIPVTPFPYDVLLPPPPYPVHRLQPSDIKVIAALGDSLTVGLRDAAPGEILLSTKMLWYHAGGDETLETHTTLSNILKKFNPNLSGFSTGTQNEAAGFNVAVGGATAQNLPAQARGLVARMKNSPSINYQEDWKLVTIFIGGNDLCNYCLDKETYSVDRYVEHLQDTLDILYKEERSAKMVNSYAEREDFAVVVQPFFRNTIMPLDSDGKPDLSFFAVDCFHFSERGHAEMAIALWNNMLEPVDHKQSYNNFTYDRSKLKCPTSVSNKGVQKHLAP
uniref:Phospholipase B1, membrane-associated n=1 Tax=Podarcis muralis TaxID=64176 RepID=A0A670HQP5_PODMU